MALADDSGAIPAAIPIVGPAGLSIVGPVGPAGPAGPQGPRGLQGSVSPSDLQAAISPVDGRIVLLEQSRQGGYITRQTFAEFAPPFVLSATATYQVPETDTGTHAGIASEADYVAGQVPNTGTFSAVGDPLVLRRTGAVGTAAIPGIQADLANIRSTRYWSRPGELIGSWTSNVTSAPAAAAPLTATGAFSLVNGVGGKALRITGTASAGPIAWLRLEDGAVYEVTYTLSRAINDAVSANNTPLLRGRAFDGTGADLGIVFLPSTAVLVADGVKSFAIRLSLTAGVGSVNLPAGTRYLRDFATGAGTTSAIDIYSIETRKIPAQEGLAVSAATLPLASRFGMMLRDRLTGEVADLSNADTIKLLQDTLMIEPDLYYFSASGDYGSSPTQVVAATTDGKGIRGLTFKNESKTAYAAIAFGGVTPSLFTNGSETYGPGAGYTYDRVPPGPIAVITDTPSSPVTCRFWRTVNSDPNSPGRIAAHLARYSGTMTSAQQSAVGDLYNTLYNSGWIGLCASSGGIWVGRAPNNFDGLIDWANSSKTFDRTMINSSAPPDTSFAGTTFNGNNSVNTLITPSASALSNHSLFVYSDSTASPSGSKVAVGNSVFRVAPNRSSTTATLYTGAGSSIVTSGGLGGLQGYRRDNVNTFRFFRNDAAGTDTTKTVTDTTGGSTPILIGALNSPSGLQLGWTGILEFSAMTFGAVPTDAQVAQLYAALTTYRNALGV